MEIQDSPKATAPLPAITVHTATMPRIVADGPCQRCGTVCMLRRLLCGRCYEVWLRARPVGVGAACAGCGNRRRQHLRYFELQRGFVVVCHNCAHAATQLRPLPRSAEGLRERLERERRLGERRGTRLGPPGSGERRRGRDRRVGARDLFDVTEMVVAEDEVKLPGERTIVSPPPAELTVVLSPGDQTVVTLRPQSFANAEVTRITKTTADDPFETGVHERH